MDDSRLFLPDKLTGPEKYRQWANLAKLCLENAEVLEYVEADVEELVQILEHWSVQCRRKGLDHVGSDRNYKTHVARLMTIYMDENQRRMTDVSSNRHNYTIKSEQLPMTLLWGRNGIRSSSGGWDQLYRSREDRWDNRTVLTENIVRPSNECQQPLEETRENYVPQSTTLRSNRPTSGSNRPSSGPSASQGRIRPTSAKSTRPVSADRGCRTPTAGQRPLSGQGRRQLSPAHHTHTQQSNAIDPHTSSASNNLRKPHRNRAPHSLDEPNTIIKGLYALQDPSEVDAYYRFVSLLSNYDSFDKLKVLEDVMSDVEEITLLNRFAGTRVY